MVTSPVILWLCIPPDVLFMLLVLVGANSVSYVPFLMFVSLSLCQMFVRGLSPTPKSRKIMENVKYHHCYFSGIRMHTSFLFYTVLKVHFFIKQNLLSLLHVEVSYIIDIAYHWTFFPILPVFSYFLECQNPDFFPFSNSQFLPNIIVKFMFTNVEP